MKRSVVETVLGAVVLFVAAFFLIFSYRTADVEQVKGYTVTADFSGTGGLAIGDEVQISGVKIGSISKVELDDTTYLARVYMGIDPSIKIPNDSAAQISSVSLMGGRYLLIEPGSSDEMMTDGGRIQYTQAPQNLEQLLGKFIFSMSGSKSNDSDESVAAAPASANSYSEEAPAVQPVDENAAEDATAAP